MSANDNATGREAGRYFALVVAGQASAGAVVQASESFEKLLLLLLTEGIWPHGLDNGIELAAGDEVVFALITPEGPRVQGCAIATSPSEPMLPEHVEAARLYLGTSMPTDLRAMTHSAELEEFQVWDDPWEPASPDDATVGELAQALDSAFTTGLVRKLPPQTFGKLVGREIAADPEPVPIPDPISEPEPIIPPTVAVAPPPAEPPTPAAPTVAGLLVQNWNLVDFGEPLALLNGAANGDRTDTPAGPIDALCEASDTGDMVAMIWADGEAPDELARSVPKRLAWLREYRARPGQRVRGILVTGNGSLDGSALNGADVDVRRLRILCTSPDEPAVPEAVPVAAAPEPEKPVAKPARELRRGAVPPALPDEMDFAKRCIDAVQSRRKP